MAEPAGANQHRPDATPGAAGHSALLLHGQPGSARDWDLVVAALPPRISALAIDRPGYDPDTEPGGVAHSGRAAIARLDQLGIGRAIVAGVSFGGAVAAWIAAHHPERVAALVLISPAANLAALKPVDRLLGARVGGRLASTTILAGAGLALTSHRLRLVFMRRLHIPEDYAQWTGRRLRSRSVRDAFVVEQRAMLVELPGLEAELPRIEAPTTIVIGTEDATVPPSAGRRLARQIPGSELVVIEGAGHVLTAEEPRRIARLIVAAGDSIAP